MVGEWADLMFMHTGGLFGLLYMVAMFLFWGGSNAASNKSTVFKLDVTSNLAINDKLFHKSIFKIRNCFMDNILKTLTRLNLKFLYQKYI